MIISFNSTKNPYNRLTVNRINHKFLFEIKTILSHSQKALSIYLQQIWRECCGRNPQTELHFRTKTDAQSGWAYLPDRTICQNALRHH